MNDVTYKYIRDIYDDYPNCTTEEAREILEQAFKDRLGEPMIPLKNDGISGKPYMSKYFIDKRYDKPEIRTIEDLRKACEDAMREMKGY